MPQRTIRLGPDAPKKALLQWDSGWANMRLKMNGNQIGEAIGKAELVQGHDWKLPDHSEISIRLRSIFLGGGLKIKRTLSSHQKAKKGARSDLGWSFFVVSTIGLVSIGLGFLQGMPGAERLAELGFTTESIFSGVLYILIALFLRSGSAVAVAVGLGFLGMEILSSHLIVTSSEEYVWAPIPALFRVIILAFLLLAAYSIRTLREKPKMYMGSSKSPPKN